MYEEESDSEPKEEESEYIPEETEEIEEPKKEKKTHKKEKIIFLEYLNYHVISDKEISDKVFLRNIDSLYDDAGQSSALDRTASNYNDAKEKVKNIRELINTGRYDEDIAK